MTEFKHLQADISSTTEDMKRRGLLGSVARYGLISCGLSGLVVGNYIYPGFEDAVAQITEADLSRFSGPARAIYAENLLTSLDNLSADVMGALDTVASWIEEKTEHYKNGTFIEVHKDAIAEQELFGLKAGNALVSAWDWALTTDPNAETFIGRSPISKAAIGVASATIMTVIAAKTVIGVAGKTLDAMAETVSQANRLASSSKTLAVDLFTKMRSGVKKGIDAALGRRVPDQVTPPFPSSEPEAPTRSVEISLLERLRLAGVEDDVAQSIVSEITDQISRKDQLIEALNSKTERVEDQMAQIHRVVFALNAKIDELTDPEEANRLRRRAVADNRDEPQPDPSETPTLH